MHLRVLAVGTKMPGWVQAGVDEYAKRMPRELNVQWQEIPPAKRGGSSPARYREQEAELLRHHGRNDTHRVALDVAGKLISTEDMAAALADWQMNGERVSLIIGGADGLEPTLLAETNRRWSLGRITLPHPLVRVVLAEQLYRAWSITAGHPYHRG